MTGGKTPLLASWKTSAVLTGVVLVLAVVWLSSALAGGNTRAWFGFAVAVLLVAGGLGQTVSRFRNQREEGPRPSS